MKLSRSWRLCAEISIGSLSALALAATLIWPDWIERLTGLEPDGGDGTVEWGLVLSLCAMTLAAFGMAWRDLRKRPPAAELEDPARL